MPSSVSLHRPTFYYQPHYFTNEAYPPLDDSHDFIPGSAHAIVFYCLFTAEYVIITRVPAMSYFATMVIAAFVQSRLRSNPCIWIEYERVSVRTWVHVFVCDRWDQVVWNNVIALRRHMWVFYDAYSGLHSV